MNSAKVQWFGKSSPLAEVPIQLFYYVQRAWEFQVVFLLYQLLTNAAHAQFDRKSDIFGLQIGSFQGPWFPTAGHGKRGRWVRGCVVTRAKQLVVCMRVGSGQTMELSTGGLCFRPFYYYYYFHRHHYRRYHHHLLLYHLFFFIVIIIIIIIIITRFSPSS